LYAAFRRGDVPSILATVDDEITMHSPQTLPHGEDFRSREQVAGFFQGIGEHWESLQVDVDELLSCPDQVIVLVHAHGLLRSTGEEAGYGAAHAWTLRDGTPVRFHEYVDAPGKLGAAQAAAR
jgi:ketosteroid isomerase-like protein